MTNRIPASFELPPYLKQLSQAVSNPTKVLAGERTVLADTQHILGNHAQLALRQALQGGERGVECKGALCVSAVTFQ